MTYKSLLAHLDLGRLNTAVLQITGDLAGLHGAKVLGIAGAKPITVFSGDGSGIVQKVDANYDAVAEQIASAEAEFRAALSSKASGLEWRAEPNVASIADFIATQARCADLIITSAARKASFFDDARQTNIGDLVMTAGRPVLLVPEAAEDVRLNHALVAWKNTRESRRALSDALPLMRSARRATLVQIAPREALNEVSAGLADVAAWLGRHGVTADTLALPKEREDAIHLTAIAEEQDADVLIAGAYGHSRAREWVLGGVTGDLLVSGRRCALVSH